MLIMFVKKEIFSSFRNNSVVIAICPKKDERVLIKHAVIFIRKRIVLPTNC